MKRSPQARGGTSQIIGSNQALFSKAIVFSGALSVFAVGCFLLFVASIDSKPVEQAESEKPSGTREPVSEFPDYIKTDEDKALYEKESKFGYSDEQLSEFFRDKREIDALTSDQKEIIFYAVNAWNEYFDEYLYGPNHLSHLWTDPHLLVGVDWSERCMQLRIAELGKEFGLSARLVLQAYHAAETEGRPLLRRGCPNEIEGRKLAAKWDSIFSPMTDEEKQVIGRFRKIVRSPVTLKPVISFSDEE